MSMLSRFATTGGGGDPYWSNVSYLLVGNGANGTTTNIKDSSSNNLTTTITGHTVISTAKSKYGSGSVLFDGAGDYLQVTNDSVLQFGSQNFTIEGWYYAITANVDSVIICKWSASNTHEWFLANVGGVLGFYWSTTGSSFSSIGSGAMPISGWNYITVVRNGNTISLYKNGVLNASATVTSPLYVGSAPVTIGTNGEVPSGWTFNGYLYDIRLTKGVARYTSNFTPPTAPLPIG
jgi:hypothetical protein